MCATSSSKYPDARIAKLLDYDARFAADLDTVARRAAEEVHARFGHANTQAQRNQPA